MGASSAVIVRILESLDKGSWDPEKDPPPLRIGHGTAFRHYLNEKMDADSVEGKKPKAKLLLRITEALKLMKEYRIPIEVNLSSNDYLEGAANEAEILKAFLDKSMTAVLATDNDGIWPTEPKGLPEFPSVAGEFYHSITGVLTQKDYPLYEQGVETIMDAYEKAKFTKGSLGKSKKEGQSGSMTTPDHGKKEALQLSNDSREQETAEMLPMIDTEVDEAAMENDILSPQNFEELEKMASEDISGQGQVTDETIAETTNPIWIWKVVFFTIHIEYDQFGMNQFIGRLLTALGGSPSQIRNAKVAPGCVHVHLEMDSRLVDTLIARGESLSTLTGYSLRFKVVDGPEYKPSPALIDSKMTTGFDNVKNSVYAFVISIGHFESGHLENLDLSERTTALKGAFEKSTCSEEGKVISISNVEGKEENPEHLSDPASFKHWLSTQKLAGSTVIMAIATHGKRVDDEPALCFSRTKCIGSEWQDVMKVGELRQVLRETGAKNLLLILNSCHGGFVGNLFRNDVDDFVFLEDPNVFDEGNDPVDTITKTVVTKWISEMKSHNKHPKSMHFVPGAARVVFWIAQSYRRKWQSKFFVVRHLPGNGGKDCLQVLEDWLSLLELPGKPKVNVVSFNTTTHFNHYIETNQGDDGNFHVIAVPTSVSVKESEFLKQCKVPLMSTENMEKVIHSRCPWSDFPNNVKLMMELADRRCQFLEGLLNGCKVKTAALGENPKDVRDTCKKIKMEEFFGDIDWKSSVWKYARCFTAFDSCGVPKSILDRMLEHERVIPDRKDSDSNVTIRWQEPCVPKITIDKIRSIERKKGGSNIPRWQELSVSQDGPVIFNSDLHKSAVEQGIVTECEHQGEAGKHSLLCDGRCNSVSFGLTPLLNIFVADKDEELYLNPIVDTMVDENGQDRSGAELAVRLEYSFAANTMRMIEKVVFNLEIEDYPDLPIWPPWWGLSPSKTLSQDDIYWLSDNLIQMYRASGMLDKISELLCNYSWIKWRVRNTVAVKPREDSSNMKVDPPSLMWDFVHSVGHKRLYWLLERPRISCVLSANLKRIKDAETVCVIRDIFQALRLGLPRIRSNPRELGWQIASHLGHHMNKSKIEDKWPIKEETWAYKSRINALKDEKLSRDSLSGLCGSQKTLRKPLVHLTIDAWRDWYENESGWLVHNMRPPDSILNYGVAMHFRHKGVVSAVEVVQPPGEGRFLVSTARERNPCLKIVSLDEPLFEMDAVCEDPQLDHIVTSMHSAGNYLITGDQQGNVILWDIQQHSVVQSKNGHLISDTGSPVTWVYALKGGDSEESVTWRFFASFAHYPSVLVWNDLGNLVTKVPTEMKKPVGIFDFVAYEDGKNIVQVLTSDKIQMVEYKDKEWKPLGTYESIVKGDPLRGILLSQSNDQLFFWSSRRIMTSKRWDPKQLPTNVVKNSKDMENIIQDVRSLEISKLEYVLVAGEKSVYLLDTNLKTNMCFNAHSYGASCMCVARLKNEWATVITGSLGEIGVWKIVPSSSTEQSKVEKEEKPASFTLTIVDAMQSSSEPEGSAAFAVASNRIVKTVPLRKGNFTNPGQVSNLSLVDEHVTSLWYRESGKRIIVSGHLDGSVVAYQGKALYNNWRLAWETCWPGNKAHRHSEEVSCIQHLDMFADVPIGDWMYFATASWDMSLRVWKITCAQETFALECIACSDDIENIRTTDKHSLAIVGLDVLQDPGGKRYLILTCDTIMKLWEFKPNFTSDFKGDKPELSFICNFGQPVPTYSIPSMKQKAAMNPRDEDQFIRGRCACFVECLSRTEREAELWDKKKKTELTEQEEKEYPRRYHAVMGNESGQVKVWTFHIDDVGADNALFEETGTLSIGSNGGNNDNPYSWIRAVVAVKERPGNVIIARNHGSVSLCFVSSKLNELISFTSDHDSIIQMVRSSEAKMMVVAGKRAELGFIYRGSTKGDKNRIRDGYLEGDASSKHKKDWKEMSLKYQEEEEEVKKETEKYMEYWRKEKELYSYLQVKDVGECLEKLDLGVGNQICCSDSVAIVILPCTKDAEMAEEILKGRYEGKVLKCKGGPGVANERTELQCGVRSRVVVGTPLRLLDPIKWDVLCTATLKHVIIFNINDMLKNRHEDAIRWILEEIPPTTSVTVTTTGDEPDAVRAVMGWAFYGRVDRPVTPPVPENDTHHAVIVRPTEFKSLQSIKYISKETDPAEMFRETFSDVGYSPSNIRVLGSEDSAMANHDDFLNYFKSLPECDTLTVVVMTHGTRVPKSDMHGKASDPPEIRNTEAALCLPNTEVNKGSVFKNADCGCHSPLRNTVVTVKELGKTLVESRKGNVMLILQACHMGLLRHEEKYEFMKSYNDPSGRGIRVITSTSPIEHSRRSDPFHQTFDECIRRGLRGGLFDENSRVTADDLCSYASTSTLSKPTQRECGKNFVVSLKLPDSTDVSPSQAVMNQLYIQCREVERKCRKERFAPVSVHSFDSQQYLGDLQALEEEAGKLAYKIYSKDWDHSTSKKVQDLIYDCDETIKNFSDQKALDSNNLHEGNP